MENNKKKIKIIHRIMATICLALFCGAVFISHYQPIKTYADNTTETHYRMPSGIWVNYYGYDNNKIFAYPMYAYTTETDNDFYSGIISPISGEIEYLATNHLSAPNTSNLATVSSWLVPAPLVVANPTFKMIEFFITDYYGEFNISTQTPLAITITDDLGSNTLPLCDVYIDYTVFNFDNGIYQSESQVINDLDLNQYGIMANHAFSLSYFMPDSKILHCKDITVLVIFENSYNTSGIYVSLELTRVTNADIDDYNGTLYDHTWEYVEVSVNYLQSFYDTITGFLAIELLPHFTIATMLELAIAIPLVVWFLKSWLGG